MFTGLVEDVGTIADIGLRGNYRVLSIVSVLADEHLRIGDSVNCDGACLTVVRVGAGTFTVEASPETAARTILNDYRRGDRLNLERALRAGDRLGGHFVLGHVDTTGTIEHARSAGESREIAVTFDPAFDALVVEKGSIALDGISLTVNAVRSAWLVVSLIPHSLARTTAGGYQAGRRVNIEFDMIGKYIIKIRQSTGSNTLTLDKLRQSGW